jgi:hypothetical protein
MGGCAAADYDQIEFHLFYIVKVFPENYPAYC